MPADSVRADRADEPGTISGAIVDTAVTVEHVDLGDGSWLDVARGLVTDADAVHDELAGSVMWQQGRVFRYERWIDEPRLSGMQRGSARHPALVAAQAWLTRRYGVRFDAVALALYRDGRDSVAWHRDRELRWLDDTVIAVLTLGAQRPWLLKPISGRRTDPGDERDLDGALDVRPASGDMLVMGGRCQAAWLHAVPKTATPVGPRISAQWRWTSRRGRRDINPGYRAPRHFTT